MIPPLPSHSSKRTLCPGPVASTATAWRVVGRLAQDPRAGWPGCASSSCPCWLRTTRSAISRAWRKWSETTPSRSTRRRNQDRAVLEHLAATTRRDHARPRTGGWSAPNGSWARHQVAERLAARRCLPSHHARAPDAHGLLTDWPAPLGTGRDGCLWVTSQETT
jgi:hypothetical protein